MRFTAALRFGSALVLGTVGCASHGASSSRRSGEAHGLFLVGFETTMFRSCDAGDWDHERMESWQVERVESDTLVLRVARDREVVPGRFAPAGVIPADVYYVRWVARRLPPRHVAEAGTIRILNAPTLAVEQVLEVRTPRKGECGYRAPGGSDAHAPKRVVQAGARVVQRSGAERDCEVVVG